MEKKETALVRKCLAWVKEQGGVAYHVHGSAAQRAGEPDIDGALPHPAGGWVHFKIELKVGDNKLSPLQQARLDDWGKLGYATGVAYSLDDFQALVLKGIRLHQRSPVKRLGDASTWP